MIIVSVLYSGGTGYSSSNPYAFEQTNTHKYPQETPIGLRYFVNQNMAYRLRNDWYLKRRVENTVVSDYINDLREKCTVEEKNKLSELDSVYNDGDHAAIKAASEAILTSCSTLNDLIKKL